MYEIPCARLSLEEPHLRNPATAWHLGLPASCCCSVPREAPRNLLDNSITISSSRFQQTRERSNKSSDSPPLHFSRLTRSKDSRKVCDNEHETQFNTQKSSRVMTPNGRRALPDTEIPMLPCPRLHSKLQHKFGILNYPPIKQFYQSIVVINGACSLERPFTSAPTFR